MPDDSLSWFGNLGNGIGTALHRFLAYWQSEPLPRGGDDVQAYDFTLAAIVFGVNATLNVVDGFVNGFAKKKFSRIRSIVRSALSQFRASATVEQKKHSADRTDGLAKAQISKWRRAIRTEDHRIYERVMCAKCVVKCLMFLCAAVAVVCMIHPCTQRWIALLLLPYPLFRGYCWLAIEWQGKHSLNRIAREINAATHASCALSLPTPLGSKTRGEIRRLNMTLFIVSSRFMSNRSVGFKRKVADFLNRHPGLLNLLAKLFSV